MILHILLDIVSRSSSNLPYEKVGKKEPVCIADEVPCDIPDTWEWTRLSVANEMYTGNSINENEKKAKYMGLHEGRFYIGTKDVSFSHDIDYDNGVRIPYDNDKFRVAPQNSILMCIEGGSAGRKIAFTNQDVCFGNKLCCFVSYGIDPLYLYYYLQCPLFQTAFKDNTSGIIGGVSVNVLKDMLLPVPPYKEQKRIVSEIEKHIPYIEQYDVKETALRNLTVKFPQTLKQSILQQAVMGKLVPQDENDEPASILLDRIRAEKQALIEAGNLKKDKHESVIYRRDNSHYEKLDGIERCIDDEIPFDLPESWAWSRFSTLCNTLTCGYASTPEYVSEDIGKPFISAKNVKPFHFMPDDHKYIRRELFETLRDGCCPRKGDILLTRVGAGIGEAAIIDSDLEFAIYVSLTLIKLANYELLNNKYILYWLNSPISILAAASNTYGKGASQGNLNVKNVRNYLVPLPPTKEQTRIVAKIDQLMLGCNKL